MAPLKTQPNDASVEAFLNTVENDQERADSFALLDIMREITGAEPQMWGSSIIGFDRYHYRYASGRENEWFQVGFSPRKQSLTLYIMTGFDAYDKLLERLGKHKTGKSCLYIKRLADVDLDTLRELIAASVAHVTATQP